MVNKLERCKKLAARLPGSQVDDDDGCLSILVDQVRIVPEPTHFWEVWPAVGGQYPLEAGLTADAVVDWLTDGEFNRAKDKTLAYVGSLLEQCKQLRDAYAASKHVVAGEAMHRVLMEIVDIRNEVLADNQEFVPTTWEVG